jgi:hypothetical protein
MNNLKTKAALAAFAVAFTLPSFATVLTGPTGTDTSWADHSYTGAEGGTGAINNNGTAFAHEWQFQLTSPSSGSASIVALPLFSRGVQTVGITGGTLSLYLDTGVTGFSAGDTLIATSLNFTSTGASFGQSYSGLSAGNYFYRITGTTLGASGGNYSFNSEMTVTPTTSNVPLPASLALVLLPLGLLLRKSTR